MSEAAIVERLTAELGRAADQVAADATRLVSITIDMAGEGDIARVDVKAERKTRTLIFLSAEALDAGGVRIASANAVHRVSA